MIFPYIPTPPTKEEWMKRLNEKEKDAVDRMRMTALNYAARVRQESNGTSDQMLLDAEAIYLFLKDGTVEKQEIDLFKSRD